MDTTIGAREVVGHFIGGAEMAPAAGRGGRSGPVYDPSTGEVARHVAFAERAEVEAAVSAAKSAFDGWSKTPPVRRARVLFNYLALVRENRDLLAQIITAEHGKTIADALGEIDRGIEVIEFACGIPQLGMLGINVPVPVPVPMAWFGFGGWNRSMFGDLHAYGSEGLRFYTKQKSVMQRWPREPAPAQFAMPSAH